MKLRRKPIEVEAEKVIDLLLMYSTEEGKQKLPPWIKKLDEAGGIIWSKYDISVYLNKEFLTARSEDYLICGVDGKVYPASASVISGGYEICQ